MHIPMFIIIGMHVIGCLCHCHCLCPLIFVGLICCCIKKHIKKSMNCHSQPTEGACKDGCASECANECNNCPMSAFQVEASKKCGEFVCKMKEFMAEGAKNLKKCCEEAEQQSCCGMEVVESNDKYTIRIDVPGIKKESIHMEIRENVMTVKAERQVEAPTEGDTVRVMGRAGELNKRFVLCKDVDPEQCNAKLEDGVLTIVIMKKEECIAKTHIINVE